MRTSTLGRRAALVAGAAALVASGLTTTASAAGVTDPTTNDWGTVVPGKNCSQAQSWVARVQGLVDVVDTSLFAAHSPPTPDAPETGGGGKDLFKIPFIGNGSALYSRALTNKLPGVGGTADLVPALCHAYAEAGGANVDVGLPYVPPPPGCQLLFKGVPGYKCTQLSGIGVHAEGITVSATAKPGKPVAFKGYSANAYFSVAGYRVVDVVPDGNTWPVNFGARIPPDLTLPAIAQAITNEQRTTDGQGRPTVDAKGKYFQDPTASSGYINAAHATALGTNAADATVGHAAVLIDERYLPAPICKYTSARCAGTTR